MSSRVRKDKNPHRKTWAVLFVIVSLFCIIFFAAKGRFQAPANSKAVSLVLSPFQQTAAWIGGQLDYVTSTIWDIATAHEQNKLLRKACGIKRLMLASVQLTVPGAHADGGADRVFTIPLPAHMESCRKLFEPAAVTPDRRQ